MRPEVEISPLGPDHANPQVRQLSDFDDAVLTYAVRTPRNAILARKSGLDDVNGRVQLSLRHASRHQRRLARIGRQHLCRKMLKLFTVGAVYRYMNLRESNEGQCLRKKPYRTKPEAETTALKCWEKRQVRLRAYLCPNCHWWHLTKMVIETGREAKSR